MNAPPQFTLDKHWWTASVVLSSWAGFQNRSGHYGAQASDRPSDGIVRLVIAPEGRGAEPLTESEIASATWVLEHEAEIARSLLDAVLKHYPAMQEQYGYSEQERQELMPDVKSVHDFRNLIGLHSVNVHQVTKNGFPYIGFEFGCSWDDEHGLGVLMHGTRPVEVGGADTAILLWIAEKDAENP